MATYTGLADGNGDFTVNFPSNYTGGQKITVSAEKDGGTATIELNAPSGIIGGGSILFSGNINDFPVNIGVVTLRGFTGKIQNDAFRSYSGNTFLSRATGLIIETGVTEIGDTAFYDMGTVQSIILPDSVETIDANAFAKTGPNYAITTITALGVKTIGGDAFGNQQAQYINLGTAVTSIGSSAFNCARCIEFKISAATPPSLGSNGLWYMGNVGAAVIKVPAASVDAYKAATGWSAFASRIVAI